jgi:acyl-CoA synthetase (AMP-forming)/AMP-acid ligase II
MTHIFGLGTVLVASLVAGATLLMRASFDPADALDDLANHGLTQLQGPPTLFSRLLAHLEQIGVAHPPAPRLRYVYTGAGPLDMALKQRVEAAFGKPLHHGYGLSEYAGIGAPHAAGRMAPGHLGGLPRGRRGACASSIRRPGASCPPASAARSGCAASG